MSESLFDTPRFTAIVDQLAAIIRDALDRMDSPITDPAVRSAVGFTARLLLHMDSQPCVEVLITQMALKQALEDSQ